jgi:glycosyltransferase involved in cell wall biosynthesis
VTDPERGTRPLRVLLVTAATERGGAEVVMEQIAARLDRQRAEPLLATPSPGPLGDAWRARGWTVVPMPPVDRLRRVDQGARVVTQLATAIRTLHVDVVHTHGVAAQVHGGLAARRARRPVVYHVHDRFDDGWSSDGLLHRLALRVPSDVVVAISETVAASLRGRVAPEKLRVVMDGVDTEIVSPVPRASPLIAWCGRLQRWKGAHLLLDAARRIHDVRPDARFAIVGGTMFGLDVAYADELHRQAEALGLSAVVEWAGHVDDARPWLGAATLCAHTSTRPEPFGLVMAEAMMQARPVVAFREGGAAEIVADGETGLLVTPQDTGALARAVLDLLGDDARCRRMGEAARRRALDRFDADRMTRDIQALYDWLPRRAAVPARAASGSQ